MKIFRQYQYSYPHKSDYKPIDKLVICNAIKNMTKADYYVHIPFCYQKCGFCNLFSKCGVNGIEEYLQALKIQAEQILSIAKPKPTSLVLGGGTPSIMTPVQFDKLFNAINLTPKDVYSVVEVSPHKDTLSKIEYLKQVGFDRVSIGVQSFVQDELKAIGRPHNLETCYSVLELIATQGFKDFNMDIIYGISGQTVDTLLDSLKKTISYSPSEIFCYPLYIRKNTSIFDNESVDENIATLHYRVMVEFLTSSGYRQVSMRRFVKADNKKTVGTESCGFSDSLAFGCGGRTYAGNVHFCEPYKDDRVEVATTIYDFNKRQDFLVGQSGVVLSPSMIKRRYLIKNLLHAQGIDIAHYNKTFNSNLLKDYSVFSNGSIREYISVTDKFIALNDLMYSDCIVEILDENGGI